MLEDIYLTTEQKRQKLESNALNKIFRLYTVGMGTSRVNEDLLPLSNLFEHRDLEVSKIIDVLKKDLKKLEKKDA